MEGIWSKPFGVSVTGLSHKRRGIDCEDAFTTQVSADGNWIALCVSDGAGQAKFGGESSKIISNEFSKRLINIAEKINKSGTGSWINDAILESVIEIRKILQSTAGNNDLSEYSATLVACLIGSIGGISVHIGDGAVLAGKIDETDINQLTLDSEYFLSAPENQEYANQTYFITDQKWIKHIRIQTFPKADWFMLATDGGCALALNRYLKPNPNFIIPLFESLIRSTDNDSEIILQTLVEDPNFEKLTDDDKTILILMSGHLKNFSDHQLKLSESQVNLDDLTHNNFDESASIVNKKQSKIGLITQYLTRMRSMPNWLIFIQLILLLIIVTWQFVIIIEG